MSNTQTTFQVGETCMCWYQVIPTKFPSNEPVGKLDLFWCKILSLGREYCTCELYLGDDAPGKLRGVFEDVCVSDLVKDTQRGNIDTLFDHYDQPTGPKRGDLIPTSSLSVGTIVLPPVGYQDYGTPQFHNHLFVTRGNGVQGEVYLTGDPIHHCGEVGPFQESELVRYH